MKSGESRETRGGEERIGRVAAADGAGFFRGKQRRLQPSSSPSEGGRSDYSTLTDSGVSQRYNEKRWLLSFLLRRQ